MEKFAVDLDKVLDDFEFQEDQAEQVVKHSEKCDSLDQATLFERNQAAHLKPLKAKGFEDCEHSQLEEFECMPLPQASTEIIISSSASASVNSVSSYETENAVGYLKDDGKVTESIVSGNSNSEHSNLNELLLDLNEAFNGNSPVGGTASVFLPASSNTESSNLLDQSFTEDVVTPPLLSEIIQNGTFNPSKPDTLTDDELESYLAELEKEEEDEICKPVENLDVMDNANSLQSCSLKTVSVTKDKLNSIQNDRDQVIGSSDEVVSPVEEGLNLSVPDTDITSAEESSESSEIDSDTGASQQSHLQEDSASGDEEMPQLIDDPSLINCGTDITEAIASQLISQHEETQLELCADNASSEVINQVIPSNDNESTKGNDDEPVSTALVENVTYLEPELGECDFSPVNVSEYPQNEDLLEPYSSLTEDERLLGVLKPVWIPDEDAPQCMNCSQRFTVLRRRHHCRACGRVLCGNCCSSRARLEYMECKETRVCLPCLQVLRKVEAYKKWGTMTEGQASVNTLDNESQSSIESTPTSSPSPHLPNPVIRVNVNNPAEYCSTVPPALQVAAAASLPTPTVMVPVGVLKKEGTPSHPRTKSEPKQVIFSDGIRPGGDLAELDAWRAPAAEAQHGHRSVSRRTPRKTPTAPLSKSENSISSSQQLISLLPTLPPIVNGPESVEQLHQVLADPNSAPVVFAMQSSQSGGIADQHLLLVQVKLLQLDCCVRRNCWSFATSGMRWVAQDEIIILLEQEITTSSDDGEVVELLPPADIFYHLLSIYEDAMTRHHVIINLGHTVTPGTFLGSTEHGGFLFFRMSFQCVQKLILPSPPYLVGILLQRWEIPWAKVFPLRLLLRLGAEFRYYPCPLFSVRKRKSVFGEVGHTIVNLLADMRNFSYTLPAVTGLVVHMEEKETNILLPKSRYQQVCKALAQSNDHVISLAASFSPQADAHLVCLQLDDGSYQTQAINIHTRPRKVTGASFLVLNGALKSSSGLSGRSSIVEDGVMVQLLPDMLSNLKQALIRMENYTIQCGKIVNEQPEETVTLKWVDQEPSPVNSGVVSPIDGRNLTGVSSIRVMQPRDFKGEGHRLLRWTELFIIQMDDNARSASSRIEDNGDITRFSESIAKAASMALAVKLAALDPYTLIGLRISLDGDSVEYQAGANQSPLPNTCVEQLDSSLIPILHRESSGQNVPCVVELWFQVVHP